MLIPLKFLSQFCHKHNVWAAHGPCALKGWLHSSTGPQQLLWARHVGWQTDLSDWLFVFSTVLSVNVVCCSPAAWPMLKTSWNIESTASWWSAVFPSWLICVAFCELRARKSFQLVVDTLPAVTVHCRRTYETAWCVALKSLSCKCIYTSVCIQYCQICVS